MKHRLYTSLQLLLALIALVAGGRSANGAPGDIFVSDFYTNTIYKFTPDGTRSSFATGLNGPTGLAFDSANNLFEADFYSGTIYKFTADGTQTVFAMGLRQPWGLAFDAAGNLFVAEQNCYDGSVCVGASSIYKFAPDGTRSTFATGINRPWGLAIDAAGNVYGAEFDFGIINKFALDGTQSIFATGLNKPVGLTFDSAGNLFEADYYSGTIYKFAADGTRSPYSYSVATPVGLAFDRNGTLFISDGTDMYYGAVYKLAPGATYAGIFASSLDGPQCIAIQPGTTPSYAAQIQPPINPDGTSVFSAKRGVIPVKFTLIQGGVAICNLPPATIAVTRTAGGTMGQVNESVYSGSADTGSNFRISSCQYVYNLNSSVLGLGTYRLDILISGQVIGSAVFTLH